ncbi:hypothetical protein TCAL_09259 [Tigriopus californicus]|uniref:Apple domain-containing protein n=1 Tax=Tigriopus californicus TaxID=6832 RepID=A0A553N8I8_TIGCA|nr:uncharacterized protein LOC131884553 [Tigriopus californicus]XP_059088359.1 uncharacterized protein LOC131884553 [Tigriopus californicus]TRY61748.1 hypothetical protein TCAL_09259 [Tigriopus californicus]|eukprot:TCALIF_09259-PA protein Name:"Protein of unknown function" AED:0.00 eAED:0.00 QI:136/1/1/1/0.5/0.33/3/278/188
MKAFTCLIAVAIMASGAWAQSEECPFGPGSCPVTLDNVVDVFFHDVADYNSCQRECKLIDECNFFTMFAVVGEPLNHRKCFLFKSCDTLENCDHDGCITGPQDPPLDDCIGDSYTCETELGNIVDVYYFDEADDFSCRHQCELLDDCCWFTQFSITDHPSVKHKCFLFQNCEYHEPCIDCETEKVCDA